MLCPTSWLTAGRVKANVVCSLQAHEPKDMPSIQQLCDGERCKQVSAYWSLDAEDLTKTDCPILRICVSTA